jgi:hypothetical protein
MRCLLFCIALSGWVVGCAQSPQVEVESRSSAQWDPGDFDPADFTLDQLTQYLPSGTLKAVCGFVGGPLVIGFGGWLLENYGEGVVAEYLAVRHAQASPESWRGAQGILNDWTEEQITALRPTLVDINDLVHAGGDEGLTFLDHHALCDGADCAHDHGSHSHAHGHSHGPVAEPEVALLTAAQRNEVTTLVDIKRKLNPGFLSGLNSDEILTLVEIRRGAVASVGYQDLNDLITKLATMPTVHGVRNNGAPVRLQPSANDVHVLSGWMDDVHEAASVVEFKMSRRAMLRNVLKVMATGFFDLLYNYLPEFLFGPKSRPLMRSTRVANFFFHWFPFIPGSVTGALAVLGCPELSTGTVLPNQLCVATGELWSTPVTYHLGFHEDFLSRAKNQPISITVSGANPNAAGTEAFELVRDPYYKGDGSAWRYRSKSCDATDAAAQSEPCNELELRSVSNREVMLQSGASAESTENMPLEFRLEVSHVLSGEFIDPPIRNDAMVTECIDVPGTTTASVARDCSAFSVGRACRNGTPSAAACCNYCHEIPGLGGHCH